LRRSIRTVMAPARFAEYDGALQTSVAGDGTSEARLSDNSGFAGRPRGPESSGHENGPLTFAPSNRATYVEGHRPRDQRRRESAAHSMGSLCCSRAWDDESSATGMPRYTLLRPTRSTRISNERGRVQKGSAPGSWVARTVREPAMGGPALSNMTLKFGLCRAFGRSAANARIVGSHRRRLPDAAAKWKGATSSPQQAFDLIMRGARPRRFDHRAGPNFLTLRYRGFRVGGESLPALAVGQTDVIGPPVVRGGVRCVTVQSGRWYMHAMQ